MEAIDLLANRISCDTGMAVLIAIISALKKTPVQAGMVILGDLSIQGNIKAVSSLAEPLQLAMENGARRALIPMGNKRSFMEVSADILETVDPIFYSDVNTAAFKALGIV
ncbi:MAG: S16 family serine protease [Puniceicoccaceae bacterium]